ncbi:MAG TPA: cell envelope integrity protein TolA [Desulfosalsimonadaceae bacterium]|nr:cell envelope integrity protein TolA [Desulfosalsimonadaceae bacterium]
MTSDERQIGYLESTQAGWHWYAAASLLCHIVLIATVLFFPFPSVSMPDFSDRHVIEVDLAALQPQTPLPPDSAVESNQSAPAEPEAAPAPEENADEGYVPEDKPPAEPPDQPEKAVIPVKQAPEKQFDPSDYVVEKPGPKIKASMKKKTVRTAAVHRSAVEKLKEKSENSRPNPLKDRISALKSEVGSTDRKLTDRLAAKTGGDRGSARDMAQIEVYQAEVAVRLKNNWVFSEKLAGQTQGLESRLVMKIMPDGSITEVWYEKRSGNPYLDESAHRTVMKSDPLPPLPDGYPYYHLMVGFTPSGLKRR